MRLKFDYDIIAIGLGPAGMAISVMGANLGLKVCAIEKHKIGGECMNVGCIPSKALLRFAKNRMTASRFAGDAANTVTLADPAPFQRVRDHVQFIGEKKTLGMFEKVDLVLNEGAASFAGKHTVVVGRRRLTAKRIFICAGTRPALPSLPGLKDADPLTNESMFDLNSVPERLVILGGGAIATEMAQAFSRLGSKVTMIIRGERLLRNMASKEATDVLESRFAQEGITISRETTIERIDSQNGTSVITTKTGERIETDRILVALGRRYEFEKLKLEDAGIVHSDRGITVNSYLQTSQPHVYAVGDCNGFALFSHSAMHQGMIALMNSMLPWPLKRNYHDYVVPWTVFTQPEISHVGRTERDLSKANVNYTKITTRYEDYGAAIAEEIAEGFVTAYTSSRGAILGVTIVGEGSGNMINEWALAIQNNLRMHDILLLQHSFPTMGFLNKRVAENWMMGLVRAPRLQTLARHIFRW